MYLKKLQSCSIFFRSAQLITESVVSEKLPMAPCPALPKLNLIQRNANYARQKNRPLDPNDPDFELAEDHLPNDFLKADFKVNLLNISFPP